ncbi:hypothetical protein [Micromonospora sp. NPDC048063]|uniref:hypothetical protein n=1 Tax=Micromonospora sp. NPDC048063 TaxID=3364256 RepID=UPI0037173609
MEISLDAEQVLLLVAVEQGRVHMDPRYTKPDFEKEPEHPFGLKRATRRLAPLKKARLVELVPEEDAGQYGVRLYKLTSRGQHVLEQVREMEAAARAEASA